MQQYTISKTVKISETQNNSLDILKSYNVNIGNFIRQAVKEKLQRDWKEIKENKNKEKTPF